MLHADQAALRGGMQAATQQLWTIRANMLVDRYACAAGMSSLMFWMAYLGMINLRIPEHLKEAMYESEAHQHHTHHVEHLRQLQNKSHAPLDFDYHLNPHGSEHSNAHPEFHGSEHSDAHPESHGPEHSDVSHDAHPESHGSEHHHHSPGYRWAVLAFYTCVSTACALSLYNTIVCSVYLIMGLNFALRGMRPAAAG